MDPQDKNVQGGLAQSPTATPRAAFGPEEVAQALGVSRDTVDRLVARGELRSFRVGRRRLISADALRDFIDARERVRDGGDR
jgi:excisionase family DNA binding protein